MGGNRISGTQESDREVKLPKLRLAIYQGEHLVRLVEVEDPRERLIRQFNKDHAETGLYAESH